MAKITISAHQHIETFPADSLPAYGRVCCNTSFQNDDDESVAASTPESGHYVKQVAASYADGITTIASFATTNRIDSTIVAATGQVKSYYSLSLHDANGRYLITVFDNIKIPAAPTTTTWADLAGLAASPFIPHHASYFDSEESDRRYLNNGGVALSSDVVYGRTALDTVPASLAAPIAVGSNSPAHLSAIESKYMEEFVSLAAAITAIGVTPTRLIIADTVDTTTATLPSNVAPIFVGNGKFNITSGVLTIKNGSGLSAPPDKQIFSGAGTVKFDANYPITFYPAWWGAAGDWNGTTGTDDLAAFNAMMNSMQRVGTETAVTYYVGGIIHLTQGKFYYCSDTLHIRRPVAMFGHPGVYSYPSGGFQFPANKQGIIIHAGSTFDGILSTTLDATGTELSGFNIRGATSVNNTILDTLGLVLTLTGGTIPTVSSAGNAGGTAGTVVTPGSTITVNGFNYVVAPTLTANSATATVPILAPRISVNADASSILVNHNNQFPTANDWAGEDVTINGVVYPIVSHTTTAITVTGTVPTGTWTATISGLKSQSGIASRINIYHGIDLRAPNLKLKDIRVQYFAGNGIDANSQRYPSHSIGTHPNNNNCRFENAQVQFCQGSGITPYGINSNNHANHFFDAGNNGGYGIYEYDTIGSNYYTFHLLYNYQGAFRLDGTSAQNELYGCYTEGGQPSGMLHQFGKIDGGAMGAAIDTSTGYVTHWTVVEGHHESAAPIRMRRDAGDYGNYISTIGIGRQLGHFNQENVIEAFGVGSEPCNTAQYPETAAKILAYQLAYNYLKDGWYGWSYGGDAATNAALKTLIAMSGDAAAEGSANLWFPLGFYAGLVSNSTRRKWSFVTAKPTTGTAALYDIYWNLGADAAECIGWICTTAGDLAVAGVVTPFGANNLESVAGTAGKIVTYAAGASGGLKLADAAETGTGAIVRTSAPNLVNPTIGGGTALATSNQTGTGNIVLANSPNLVTPNVGVAAGTSLAATGLIKSSGTAGIGYAAGAGGAQTQATSKSTTVVSNTITTAITMHNANLAADTAVSFTFTNSTIEATDTVLVTHESGGTSAAYNCNAFPGAGSAVVTVNNLSAGALAEAIVLRVTVIKSVSS